MCDYSLEHLFNRPAKIGERLTLTCFETGSQGFTSPHDPDTAVCLRPGTPVLLRGLDEPTQEFLRASDDVQAVFVKLNVPGTDYQDGIRMSNGQEALLQDLPKGLEIDVLGRMPLPDDGETLRRKVSVPHAAVAATLAIATFLAPLTTMFGIG